jgi:DNA-binding transcriptional LysR family regulator
LVRQDGRRLILTPAGRELADVAEHILAQFDGLEQFVSALRAGEAGPVRVIASNTPGSYVLPSLIAEFLQTYRGAKVELEISPMSMLWQTFGAGSYDYAVAWQGQQPPNVLSEFLYEEPIVLVAPPSHPLASARNLRLEDLRGETLVGMFVQGYWGELFHMMERDGFKRAQLIELLTYEAIKRMVEAGVGIGLLFANCVDRELAEGRLVRLNIDDQRLVQTFCLVRRPSVPMTPIARQFREFVVNALVKTPAHSIAS